MLTRRSEQAGLGSRIQIHKSQSDKIGVPEVVDFDQAFYMIHEVPNIESFFGRSSCYPQTTGKASDR